MKSENRNDKKMPSEALLFLCEILYFLHQFLKTAKTEKNNNNDIMKIKNIYLYADMKPVFSSQ